MFWKGAAHITQFVGAMVTIGAVLMVDNDQCSIEFIAEKILVGVVIIIYGLLWEEVIRERQKVRKKKANKKSARETGKFQALK